MTEFAKGGTITPDLVRKLNASETTQAAGDSDLVPALLSPGCVLGDGDGDLEDWVCGFCDRGQCARCSDEDCTCCNGNPEEQPWRT